VLTSLGWLLLHALTSVIALILGVLQLISMILLPLGLGLPVFVRGVELVRGFANMHRRWAARILDARVPSTYRSHPTWRMQDVAATLRDPATWTDFAWLFVHAVVGTVLGAIPPALLFAATVTFVAPWGAHWVAVVAVIIPAVAIVVMAWWITPWLVTAEALVTRALLAPNGDPELAERLSQVTESRAATVDARAAELRRIERDLHDGAQARLVALAMELGLAERVIDSDPAQAKAMVAESRQSAGLALADLRDLVRGIHPPVLADRGLAGAVEAAALLSPVPIRVEVQLPGRPEPPVESALYFAAAEALTNIAKHSDATSGWVGIRYDSGVLRVVVGDDGQGGANPTGNGLAGIRRRLAAFDGVVVVSSPEGGPTEILMELPCALND
jgi:signal transduction histidine kinase